MDRVFRRIVLAAFIIFALCIAGAAQRRDATNSRARRVQPPTFKATKAQANADENFELNIAERRITERDFFASTALEAGEESARGLYLRVGVAVGASEIDVLLRNVRGRVRFRGSLDALRRVLDAHRRTTTTQPSVP